MFGIRLFMFVTDENSLNFHLKVINAMKNNYSRINEWKLR